MGNTICAICGKPTEDILLTVDGKENICMDCATKMATQARAANRANRVFHFCLRCSAFFFRVPGGSAPPPFTVTYITMETVNSQ